MAANAGHEYPFITDENGRFSLFKDPHGIVLGAMAGATFSDYSLTLKKGSRIFVYTDGVAEAQNDKEEFFDLERIGENLNKNTNATPEELIRGMKMAVDEYAGSMEQFDDMTMLSITYNG